MVLLYLGAGINHFINPGFYIKIMPPWIGWHTQLVWISGVCEALFGLLLIFPATRRTGAWCIIALLVAVFPANIQMMLSYIAEHNPRLWIAILRLPVQALLVWWAYRFTKPGNPSIP